SRRQHERPHRRPSVRRRERHGRPVRDAGPGRAGLVPDAIAVSAVGRVGGRRERADGPVRRFRWTPPRGGGRRAGGGRPMKRDREEPFVTTPFPVSPVSNGEWLPGPEISAKARLTEKLIAEEADLQAKRHGMTRAQFLRTAAGTATAFWVLNKVNGLAQSGEAAVLPLQRVHCEDLDAGRELLDRDTFVMDVQTHHADTQMFPGTGLCFLRFLDVQGCQQNPEIIGQLNFVKETFVDSRTTVGVISGLPNGVPLGPEVMAQTRDLVNQLAGAQPGA